MNKKILLAFVSIALFFFSCKKDIDPNTTPVNPTNSEFNIPAPSPVNGRISGIIVDENNSPVPNATVTFKTTGYTSDANGFFTIENVVLDKYITTVTVNKTGYFKACRSFAATASRNYLSIKLIPRPLIANIDAATGGIVNLTNGTSVSFPSNAFVVKNTGAAYSGQVNVYCAYIDPTRADFSAIVPGSMMAQDSAHMFVLQSAGMLAVDIESDAGEALQLAPSKNATIQLPIPSGLASKAPATINTWSLDSRGIWIKEGTATKNGNAYTIQASHFSFWNADVPVSTVYATIHVHDQDGNPVSNMNTALSVQGNSNWWATAGGVTDSTGTVSGLVPANIGMVLNMSLNVYNCTTAFFSSNVDPISSDTTLNITVNINSLQHMVISGTATDCNALPLAQGTATIYTTYNTYSIPVVNGNYTLSVPYCANVNTAIVHISDNAGGLANSGLLSVAGMNLTVPPLTVCAAGTDPFSFVSCEPNGVFLTGMQPNISDNIRVIVNVQTIGPWTISGTSAGGLTFSGSGTFTHTGADTVYLAGTGYDYTEGDITIPLLGGNGQTYPLPLHLAFGSETGELGFQAFNYTVAGNYMPGVPMDDNNTITYIANVNQTGVYSLATETIDGIQFQASGILDHLGTDTIVFHAYGTPTSAGFPEYNPNGNFTTNQFFYVNVGNVAPGTFTFDGGTGACTGAYVVGGTWHAGSTLTESNAINFFINVISTGPYSIYAPGANGISFHYTGVFTTTGAQQIYAVGNGIPLLTGTYNYTLEGNGGAIPGCGFSVIISN